MKSAKGSRSELTTSKVSHECDMFCYKIRSVYYFQKTPRQSLEIIVLILDIWFDCSYLAYIIIIIFDIKHSLTLCLPVALAKLVLITTIGLHDQTS